MSCSFVLPNAMHWTSSMYCELAFRKQKGASLRAQAQEPHAQRGEVAILPAEKVAQATRASCAGDASVRPWVMARRTMALAFLLASSAAFSCTPPPVLSLSQASDSGSAEQLEQLAAQGDAGEELRRTFEMIDKGDITAADGRLTQSIEDYSLLRAPREHLAVLYKYRGDVRANLGRLDEARIDYSAAIECLTNAETPASAEPVSDMLCVGSAKVTVSKLAGVEERGIADYCVYTPTLSDLLIRRARVSLLLGQAFLEAAAADLALVIAEGEEEGAPTPYAHLYRGDALMLRGAYSGAATDYKVAVADFTSIGDKAQAEVARAGWAFALYGQGKEEEAVATMQDVVVRTPAVTGEIEVLLSLAEKEATVHVALAAHYWGQGKGAAAESEWDRACVRMDAMSEYLADLASKGEEVSPFDKPAAQVARQKRKEKKDLYTPPGVNRRGCKQFRDLSWVQQQRAWPLALIRKLDAFFNKVASAASPSS